MSGRRIAETSPQTLTVQEVATAFFNAVTAEQLRYLDRNDYIRPTYYHALGRPGGLITREERDLLIQSRGPQKGDPHRLYNYEDLVWIRLFIYVRDNLRDAGAARAFQRAGVILRDLRRLTPQGCPPPWRLVFFGEDVYLVEEAAVRSLTNGQLVMKQLLTDNIEAEVKGRIDALVALNEIRPIPTKCSAGRLVRMTA
jgi:hypothetical protein